MSIRLALAISSTALQEVAIFLLWLWGLPRLGVRLPLSVLVSVMVVWALVAALSFMMSTRALKRKEAVSLTMIGSEGSVVKPLAPEGQIMIKGELWGARSVEGNIEEGEKVVVIERDGLKLIVRKIKGK